MHLPLAGLTTDVTLEALVDNASVCVAVIDPEGRVVLWNRGAERIFGWSAPEAIGEFLPVILPGYGDEFHRMRRSVKEGEVFDDVRLRHRRRDGSPVEVQLTVRPLRDVTGRVCAILGIGREAVNGAETNTLLSRIESLRQEAARTEMRALQARLPPHFLFNALNGISAVLKRGDERAASGMISRLSDLLRRALAADDRERVHLREEIECVEEYLELERMRFGDRLRFEIDVDENALEALVPTLLLQPIVENAVRHGIAPVTSGGRVRIEGERRNGRLRLTVTDDGRGLSADWRPEVNEGTGLRATRGRLERMYGDRARFRIGPGNDGGTRVTLDLPFRRVDDES